jgi:signal peptidase I
MEVEDGDGGVAAARVGNNPADRAKQKMPGVSGAMNIRAWIRKGLLPLLVLGIGYQASPYRLGVVLGDSMSPTIKNGSVYFLDRDYYRSHPMRKGEVIVFRRDGINYIKRVLAVGGDSVYVTTVPSSGQDELVMDWELAPLRRLTRHGNHTALKLVRRQVPKNHCYVVGDHVEASVDSRDLGPIRNDCILGRLVETPPAVARLDHIAVVYAAKATLGSS